MNNAPHQPDSSSAGVLQPGQTLGPYTIGQQIGAGGCGVVYQAHDPLVDRSAAIKQILGGGGAQQPGGGATQLDDDMRDKVRREADLQKKLAQKHPEFLVQLIDVIDEPRGLFLISEYIDGPSLEQMLAKSPDQMSARQALGIVVATAKALEAIHDSGVIHRDLKPANILLPRSGGLKISDFGLAAVIAEQDSLSLGSARYMAPELFTGETADGRADIYSLGMIAFEMLAGRGRFDQAFRSVLRDQRNTAMRWMKWHTNSRAKVPPLSDWVEGVDQSLSDLVVRLMEKDPSRRIATAKELQQVVKRHFSGAKSAAKEQGHGAGEQVATHSPGDTAPLPARGGKRMVWGAIAGVVIVAALVWGVTVSLQNRAALAADRTAARATLDRGQTSYDKGEYAQAVGVYQEVVSAWDADTDLGRESRAAKLLAAGRLDMEQLYFPEAIEKFEQALEFDVLPRQDLDDLIRQAKERGPFLAAIEQIEADIAASRFPEARQQLREWRALALAEDELAQLLEIAARLEDQQAQHEIAQLLDRSRSLVASGQFGLAMAELEQALAQAPSRPLRQRYDQLIADEAFEQAMSRATAAQTRGHLAEAINAYRVAYNVRKDPEVADIMAQLQSRLALEKGLALLESGQIEAAELKLTRSLGYRDTPAAREALSRIASSSQQNSFIRAGDQAMASGEFDAAVKQYTNAAALGTTATVDGKLTEARLRYLVWQSLEALDQEDVDTAQALYAEARRIDPDHMMVVQAGHEIISQSEYLSYLHAGDAARDASRFGEAKWNYRRAAKLMDTPEVKKRLSETEYDHLVAQARSYLSSEEYASAKALLRMAAKIRMTEAIGDMLEQIAEKLPDDTDASTDDEN